MSARCHAIAALRWTIKAVDWITGVNAEVAFWVVAGLIVWMVGTYGLHDSFGWSMWLTWLWPIVGSASVIGLILFCCWIGTLYDRLRDWTEKAYQQCSGGKES